MGIDAAEARAAIERDLRFYADEWLYLQEEEVEVPYGPIDPKASDMDCLLYTSPSPRDKRQSRMPSSA